MRCQMSTNTSPVLEPQLHPAVLASQQHSLHHSNQHQYHHHQQQQQLARSKSLNDIANDSQLAAFASDRFSTDHHHLAIGLVNNPASPFNWHTNQNHTRLHQYGHHDQQHQNHLLLATSSLDDREQNNTVTCMSMNSISPLLQNHANNHNNYSSDAANLFGTNFSTFENSLNLNNNQCSRPTPTNVFNLCNPLAVNLSDVADQIGNLHL